jgi:hypothetical protein
VDLRIDWTGISAPSLERVFKRNKKSKGDYPLSSSERLGKPIISPYFRGFSDP